MDSSVLRKLNGTIHSNPTHSFSELSRISNRDCGGLPKTFACTNIAAHGTVTLCVCEQSLIMLIRYRGDNNECSLTRATRTNFRPKCIDFERVCHNLQTAVTIVVMNILSFLANRKAATQLLIRFRRTLRSQCTQYPRFGRTQWEIEMTSTVTFNCITRTEQCTDFPQKSHSGWMCSAFRVNACEAHTQTEPQRRAERRRFQLEQQRNRGRE